MSNRPSSNDSDDENPFVAFRRMADQQIASFFNSFGEKPTLPQQQEGANETEDSIKKLLKYNADFLKHIEASEEAALHDNDVEKNTDEDRFKSWMTRQDLDEERRRLLKEGENLIAPFMGMVSSALSRVFGDDSLPMFPGFGWFMTSNGQKTYNEVMSDPEYSPDVLQDSRNPKTSHFPWHAAFIDLLAESGVQNVPAEDDIFPPAIAGLLRRQQHPAEPQTELDFYLGNSNASAKVRSPVSEEAQQHPSPKQVPQLQKPDILSTLTTTHRTTTPDGRTITKTVCKRRFSDGREEVEETTNESRSTQSRPAQEPPSRSLQGVEQKTDIASEIKKSNGNWFWSR